jgi:hypothetical protein
MWLSKFHTYTIYGGQAYDRSSDNENFYSVKNCTSETLRQVQEHAADLKKKQTTEKCNYFPYYT